MDVNKIREDFPLLKNRDIIYLDKADRGYIAKGAGFR